MTLPEEYPELFRLFDGTFNQDRDLDVPERHWKEVVDHYRRAHSLETADSVLAELHCLLAAEADDVELDRILDELSCYYHREGGQTRRWLLDVWNRLDLHSRVQHLERAAAAVGMSRYEGLHELFGGWFHRDRGREVIGPDGDWCCVIDRFVTYEGADRAAAVRDELNELLALDVDDANLTKYLRELGLKYSPRDEGEIRVWLVEIRERLLYHFLIAVTARMRGV